MAPQNRNPATASIAAARKEAQPRGDAAPGPVGKRSQQEVMALMMSGNKGISAFPESDHLFKWVGTIHGAAGTATGSMQSSSLVSLLSLLLHSQYSWSPNMWSLGWSIKLLLFHSLWLYLSIPEPNTDSPPNTQAAELWKSPAAFKKYLQETYAKQVSSQDP
ncbi:ubiquitin-conjugating enzyme E2 C-like isoform X2 [Saccopteryx bilineata]|uniref:ubiquitin-conjugating enzyme E2 C-like isoform X2 n=1 Tax=Saccopteryx bilineata TaxID=59482 RepID=UPI00338E1411